MFSLKDTLAKTDPELWKAIEDENRRQEDHIELIASENYVSRAVMEAHTPKSNINASGAQGGNLLAGGQLQKVKADIRVGVAELLDRVEGGRGKT